MTHNYHVQTNLSSFEVRRKPQESGFLNRKQCSFMQRLDDKSLDSKYCYGREKNRCKNTSGYDRPAIFTPSAGLKP